MSWAWNGRRGVRRGTETGAQLAGSAHPKSQIPSGMFFVTEAGAMSEQTTLLYTRCTH